MNVRKMLVPALLAFAFFTFACVYIVLPEGLETPVPEVEGAAPKVWSALVTGVGKSDAGDLHIDLAIRNDTGDWSTMHAVEGKPAVLTASDGKTTNCDTVFVGTGGHRFAPGFQMRGYTAGTIDAPELQPLYVECKGVDSGAGAALSIEYVGFGGILDDYAPDANEMEGVLELKLDEVVADLQYPVAAPVEGLVQPADTSFTGLSENVITMLDAQRTDTGFEFSWQNFNPSKFPLKTHIGTPPVIGSDGIIYGAYESLDIAEIPITPPKGNSEWKTVVVAPKDVKGFYILLSVESKKPRTYANYVVDISNK